MEAKKDAYMELVESKDEEEIRVNRERYKARKKETKLVVTIAMLEWLYEELQDKAGIRSCIGRPR